MNNRIEACINCKVQCRLEETSERIIDGIKNGDLTIAGVKQKISLMSQEAHNKTGCPNSEIQRVRIEIAKITGDRTLIRLINSNPAFTGSISAPTEDSPRFSQTKRRGKNVYT